jgi:Zn-dependent protease with chaperone function
MVETRKRVVRKVRKGVLKSPAFYFFLLVLVALLFHGRFQRFYHDLPEPEVVPDGGISLVGDLPGYRTGSGYELTARLSSRLPTRIYHYLATKYYDLYRHNYARGRLLTQFVRIDENQLSEIHWMVADACSVLQVHDVPEVYLGTGADPGILVTNFRDPVLIVNSDMVWAFSSEELRFLLAREVAHIRCEHVFLLDMIGGLSGTLDVAIPDYLAGVLFAIMGGDLLEWREEAEICADRGGLAVSGNIHAASTALVKLNVGADVETRYGSPDAELFANQIDDLGESKVTSTSAALSELRNANPFLTARTHHLLGWYEKNRRLFMERSRRPQTAAVGRE